MAVTMTPAAILHSIIIISARLGVINLIEPAASQPLPVDLSAYLPSTPPEPPTTFRAWYSEGVDYALHPQAVRRERNDCSALYVWCVRRGTDLHAVCGFNTHTGYYTDFYNLCELEFENCDWRVRKHHGVYGRDRRDDPVYYNGESQRCEYYSRRAHSQDEMDWLYFGGDKQAALATWRAQSRAEERLQHEIEERGVDAAMMETDEPSQGTPDTDHTGAVREHHMPRYGTRGLGEAQSGQLEMLKEEMKEQEMLHAEPGHEKIGQENYSSAKEQKQTKADNIYQIEYDQDAINPGGMDQGQDNMQEIWQGAMEEEPMGHEGMNQEESSEEESNEKEIENYEMKLEDMGESGMKQQEMDQKQIRQEGNVQENIMLGEMGPEAREIGGMSYGKNNLRDMGQEVTGSGRIGIEGMGRDTMRYIGMKQGGIAQAVMVKGRPQSGRMGQEGIAQGILGPGRIWPENVGHGRYGSKELGTAGMGLGEMGQRGWRPGGMGQGGMRQEEIGQNGIGWGRMELEQTWPNSMGQTLIRESGIGTDILGQGNERKSQISKDNLWLEVMKQAGMGPEMMWQSRKGQNAVGLSRIGHEGAWQETIRQSGTSQMEIEQNKMRQKIMSWKKSVNKLDNGRQRVMSEEERNLVLLVRLAGERGPGGELAEILL